MVVVVVVSSIKPWHRFIPHPFHPFFSPLLSPLISRGFPFLFASRPRMNNTKRRQNYCSQPRLAAPLFRMLLGRQLTRNSATHNAIHTRVARRQKGEKIGEKGERKKEGGKMLSSDEMRVRGRGEWVEGRGASFVWTTDWKCLGVSVKGIYDDPVIPDAKRVASYTDSLFKDQTLPRYLSPWWSSCFGSKDRFALRVFVRWNRGWKLFWNDGIWFEMLFSKCKIVT